MAQEHEHEHHASHEHGPSERSGWGFSFLAGIIILIVVLLLLFYLIPVLRQQTAPGPINIPRQIDINIKNQ